MYFFRVFFQLFFRFESFIAQFTFKLFLRGHWFHLYRKILRIVYKFFANILQKK